MGWTMEERHVGTILDEYINLRKENERLKSSLQEERSKNQAKDKLILDLQKNNSYLRSDVDKANIRAHEAEKECKSFQRLLGKLYVKKVMPEGLCWGIIKKRRQRKNTLFLDVI